MQEPTELQYQIVAAMIDSALFSNGVKEEFKPDSIKILYNSSLKEMLEANHAIKNYNDKRQDNKLSVMCDDRLIAATYTLLHYPASHMNFILVRPDKKAVLMILPENASIQLDDENEE